ncbi:hypothetical protein C4556_01165 [Candidatus Parcubacteria bacterium]|nr:MAG: hypothetical protein C4556_01165 [Candidatus Parcubacteria bacterium]
MHMSPSKTPQDLAVSAEALLFVEGGSMTRKKLGLRLSCNDKELAEALSVLSARLEGSGLTLIDTGNEVTLAVAKAASETVREVLEKELSREIGDAGLEVLAIVLYCGPSTRARIDYIRGVNTASTLRTLLARGLLEREGNPEDGREYLYKATAELLAHLGVANVNELPNYAETAAELARFEAASATDKDHETFG